jgi:hypothetical protein
MSKQQRLGAHDAGDPDFDPSPEDVVKINLSRWFEDHNATVYWEKNPSYGYGVFQSTGDVDHPDLLIDGRYRTFAIEVKCGTDSSGVHSGASQTWRYWNDYINGRKQYQKPNGRPLDVDAFILSTEHAPDGRLYYRHGSRDTIREMHVADRLGHDGVDEPIKWLPDWEFASTDSVTRLLWQFAKESVTDDECDEIGTGIGVMLSDRLDGSQPEPLTPDDADPFDREQVSAPQALYRTFGGGSGIAVHNWRWA